ncbi:MAG TPA: redoxin domain-containing protein, partial [Gemmataceae bacterium]|nr:redoxin domain-containing protein [Gemmataceae bacterium]
MKITSSCVGLVMTALVFAGPKENVSPIGKKIAELALRDYRGAEKSLKDYADRKLLVIAFLGTECPLAKAYGPRLAELAKEFEPKGVAFIGINSNRQDSITAITQYAKIHGIAFAILKDVKNLVADQFGAVRTPEVFVLDDKRVIRYRGRIDDQYGIGFKRTKVNHRDLATALEELLAGQSVSQPVTEAPGCFIGRVQQEAKKGEITYAKHVAPILQNRCVECHRSGEIAPFSMTSYDEVVGWTETIREVLQEGRMPPWHADPNYGEFANDSRVPEAEKQLIYRWIDDGAPQGDPKDLPKPAKFVTGWRISKPDVVITVPKPFAVPAQGTVAYQFFVVESGFTEDKWIKAAEVRPGCRSVVHHVLVHVQPPGGGTDKYGGFAANWIAATVPGARPTIYSEEMAKLVPAGSRFLFQIHYTPNGAPQMDQTSIGLVFADPKNVKKEISTEMAANGRFVIPPHAENYQVEASHTLREDSILLDMAPHTHLRGKTFQYEAIYPDGKKEILLDLPGYDFNWQNIYTLTKPKWLAKGTTLHCTATYDNSKKNPSNPDPEATVRWGDQTWEEMMIGYFTIMPAVQDLQKNPRPQKKVAVKEKPALDPEIQKLAKQALASDKDFEAFAAAVHKAFPKVDRVCVTTISNGNLRVE